MSLPTNNNIKVSFKQLGDLLLELGYTASKAEGGQLVYRHARTGSLLAVQAAPANKIVPQSIIAAAFQNVLNTNSAPEKKLRKWAAAHAA